MMNNSGTTTVCIVGGGPAGLVLALLLARAGVEVTVLEKHADFLRDFRGDTVHASTLTLLDELGLGAEFAELPQRRLDRAQIQLDAGTVTIGDLSRLPGPHRHIALVPQWDLLELLARTAAREPTFRLLRNAEAVALRASDGVVTGVRYRDRVTAAEHELAAGLTVACDGRDSTVRRAAGLRPQAFGVPMDVEWFRLPRQAGDPSGVIGRVSAGGMAVLIDRGDYWQCAFIVRKGGDAGLRAEAIERLGRRFGDLLPWLGDRATVLNSWDDVRLLSVSLDRLRRWYQPGLLLIGDAAHAMSPVGGVGINLAIQDAVAAARILGTAWLAHEPIDLSTLAAVQRRRWWPTVAVQTAQRVAHRFVIRRALQPAAEKSPSETPPRLPGVLRFIDRTPALQGVPARLVAIGPLPEHAPAWAAHAVTDATE